jgi:putative heme-binding domain-containing protein
MTASLRGDCVSRILSRQDWIDQWLGVLEKGSVGVNELSAAARQQLLHSGSRSMMVRAQRLIESGGSSMAKQELVQKYLGALAAQGDGSHDGAALYKQHCGVCHTPDDRGRTIGPSLTNLSDRRDRALVEAILNPNLAVDPKYQSYQLRTEDDELVVGAIESEVGEAIALAKADGTRIVVPRSNVAEIKNSGVSLMPEGFENLLSPAQLAAIVRYLQQPAQ